MKHIQMYLKLLNLRSAEFHKITGVIEIIE